MFSNIKTMEAYRQAINVRETMDIQKAASALSEDEAQTYTNAVNFIHAFEMTARTIAESVTGVWTLMGVPNQQNERDLTHFSMRALILSFYLHDNRELGTAFPSMNSTEFECLERDMLSAIDAADPDLSFFDVCYLKDDDGVRMGTVAHNGDVVMWYGFKNQPLVNFELLGNALAPFESPTKKLPPWISENYEAIQNQVRNLILDHLHQTGFEAVCTGREGNTLIGSILYHSEYVEWKMNLDDGEIFISAHSEWEKEHYDLLDELIRYAIEEAAHNGYLGTIAL